MILNWMINKMRSHPDWLLSFVLFSLLVERVFSRTKISANYIFLSILYSSLLLFWSIDEPVIQFAALWRPFTIVSSEWVRLTKERPHQSKLETSQFLQSLVHGGPLGRGCGKFFEVVVACILWKSLQGSLPCTIIKTFVLPDFTMALPFDGLSLFVVIVVISVSVNGFLYMSSHILDSRGNHKCLSEWVEPTMGKKLSSIEKIQLLGLAILNATCEEFTSRGFVRSGFELILKGCSMKTKNDSYISHLSNVFQGAVFGAWHFYGVPSGWTGILLTTLYGIIMGYLADFYTSLGLWLPIILHSIADYYIFAVLVRRSHRCTRSPVNRVVNSLPNTASR
jgi:hypothetical protein